MASLICWMGQGVFVAFLARRHTAPINEFNRMAVSERLVTKGAEGRGRRVRRRRHTKNWPYRESAGAAANTAIIAMRDCKDGAPAASSLRMLKRASSAQKARSESVCPTGQCAPMANARIKRGTVHFKLPINTLRGRIEVSTNAARWRICPARGQPGTRAARSASARKIPRIDRVLGPACGLRMRLCPDADRRRCGRLSVWHSGKC